MCVYLRYGMRLHSAIIGILDVAMWCCVCVGGMGLLCQLIPAIISLYLFIGRSTFGSIVKFMVGYQKIFGTYIIYIFSAETHMLIL